MARDRGGSGNYQAILRRVRVCFVFCWKPNQSVNHSHSTFCKLQSRLTWYFQNFKLCINVDVVRRLYNGVVLVVCELSNTPTTHRQKAVSCLLPLSILSPALTALVELVRSFPFLTLISLVITFITRRLCTHISHPLRARERICLCHSQGSE